VIFVWMKENLGWHVTPCKIDFIQNLLLVMLTSYRILYCMQWYNVLKQLYVFNLLKYIKNVTHQFLANLHFFSSLIHMNFCFQGLFDSQYNVTRMTDEITHIVAYKIKDFCYICEQHLTNKKWFFTLLHEYPAIARHHFYGGIYWYIKQLKTNVTFRLLKAWFRPGLNCYNNKTMIEYCPCKLYACIILQQYLSFLCTQKVWCQVQ